MVKIHKSITLSKEAEDFIQRNKINLSQFVEEKIKDISPNLDKKIKKLKELEKEMEILKEDIQETYKQYYPDNEEEYDFLKNIKDMLETRPEILEGQCELYKQRFNKKYLLLSEFKLILEQI